VDVELVVAAAVLAAYLTVTAVWTSAARGGGPAPGWAVPALWAAVVVHAALLAAVAWSGEQLPGFADSLSALALGVMVAVAWAARTEMAALGVFLLPVGTGLLGLSLSIPGGVRVAALQQVGTSWWLPVHVGLVLAAFTAFLMELGVVGLHELVRRRLKQKRLAGLGRFPALDTLAQVQERALGFGLACLGLGLAAGAAWAGSTMHHQEWVSDPKVVLSGVVWLLYAGSLAGRRQAGRPTPATSGLDLAAFLLLLFSVAGLDLVAAGFHAYGG
jgi:ABC-type uncharacterized transport system permease subunit